MELHAAVRRFETELGAEDLGHEGFMPLQCAVVEFTHVPRLGLAECVTSALWSKHPPSLWKIL